MTQFRAIAAAGLYIMLFVLGLNRHAHADQIHYSLSAGPDMKEKIDSVSVVICKEPIPEYEKLQVYPMAPDSKGMYTVSISGVDSICKAYLRIYTGKRSFRPYYYYAEPGDSVQITVHQQKNRLQLSFSGRGSRKYSVMKAISDNREKWMSDSIGFTGDPYRNLRMIKGFIGEAESQLAGWQNELSQSAADLLLTETTGFYHTQWITNINYYYRRPQSSLSQNQLLELHRAFPSVHHKNSVSGISLYYLIQLLAEAKFEMYLLSQQKGYSYTSLYQYLVSHSDPTVRERILLYFFAGMEGLRDLTGYEPVELVTCLQDAEQYMRSPDALAMLRSRSKLSMGSVFKDFELIDRSGDSISLASLKGKAVIVDIWGRGCSGCAQFARMFSQQVYPNIKGKDVTLVSIGIEKDRQTWLTALQTGKYSIPADHELSTEGSGIDHPLFKHYQLNAVPLVVLLDRNGRIYSTLTASMKSSKVLSLIEAAIAQQ